LAVYETALRTVAPAVDGGQDQFSTNVVRLENYVDHADARGTVIVGSSLAARLPLDTLPPHWTNLSLAGDSALTGLEVIAASQDAPQRVLVEINFLDRGSATSTVKDVVGWPQPLLRRLFWSYRTAYRPMNLVVAGVSWLVKQRRHAPRQEAPPPDFHGLLAMQQKDFAKQPGAALVPDLAELRSLVAKLKRNGTQVAFFEMPMDRSLMNTPREIALRQAISKQFAGFCFFSLDRGQGWQTGDGLHLLRQDAVKAADALYNAQCAKNR
jgi:hypothetical protein